MESKTKGIIFSVLVVLGTAVVFFCLGFVTCFSYGPVRFNTTEIEYVEPSVSTGTITTTSISPETTTIVETETTIKTTTTIATTLTTTETHTTISTTTKTQKNSSTTSRSGKINLNTATKEQLMTVPGIGEVYANRIIEYREEIGGFFQLEQLKEVKGIGEKRYQKWVVYFTI